jgi:hypothetical protein
MSWSWRFRGMSRRPIVDFSDGVDAAEENTVPPERPDHISSTGACTVISIETRVVASCLSVGRSSYAKLLCTHEGTSPGQLNAKAPV